MSAPITLSTQDRRRLARIAGEILDGVRITHGQRPPEGVPNEVWHAGVEQAWQDGLWLLRIATGEVGR